MTPKNFHFHQIELALELRREFPLSIHYPLELACRKAAELTSKFLQKEAFKPSYKEPTLAALDALITAISELDYSPNGCLKSLKPEQSSALSELKKNLELSVYMLNHNGFDMEFTPSGSGRESHIVPLCISRGFQLVNRYSSVALRDTKFDIPRVWRAFRLIKSNAKGTDIYVQGVALERGLRQLQMEVKLPDFIFDEIAAILKDLKPWLDQCDEQRRKAFESGDW